MSLSGRASPRATEPKTRMLRTPRRCAAASSRFRSRRRVRRAHRSVRGSNSGAWRSSAMPRFEAADRKPPTNARASGWWESRPPPHSGRRLAVTFQPGLRVPTVSASLRAVLAGGARSLSYRYEYITLLLAMRRCSELDNARGVAGSFDAECIERWTLAEKALEVHAPTTQPPIQMLNHVAYLPVHARSFHSDRTDYDDFSQTETCCVLSLVNGSRCQPLQRSRSVIPARRAIRSSSDGQT